VERDYFSARGVAAGNLLVLSKMLDAHERIDLDPPFYNATVVRTGLPVALDACNAVVSLCKDVSQLVEELLVKEGLGSLPELLRRPLLADLKLFREHFRHVATLASDSFRLCNREDLVIAFVKSRFQTAQRDFSGRFLKYSTELEVLDEEVRIGRMTNLDSQNVVANATKMDNRGVSDNEGETLRRKVATLAPNTARIIDIAGADKHNAGRKKRKTRVSRDIRHNLIVSVLEQHHDVGENGQVRNPVPLGNSEIHERLKGKVATGSITKWMKEHFGETGQLGYEAACKSGRFGPKFLTMKDEYYRRDGREPGHESDD